MLVLLFVLGLLLPPPLGTICLWALLLLLTRRAIGAPPGPARTDARVGAAVIGLLLVAPIVMLVPARAETSGHSESTASATAANDCQAYYEDAVIHDGPVQLATVHLNVGMCRTGSGYVRDWGPDCYVSGSLVWGGGTTWCGVYGNSELGAQPGTNFYLYPFSLPGSRKGGAFRLMLAPDGSATLAAWY
jgi:hypothetical protein